MVKDKKGWIRIVEAFVAILLITGVILILLNKQEISERDISLKVYQTEIAILREIELDDNLRADILGVDKSLLPVDWEDEEFPLTIKEKISERAPNYMKCIGKQLRMIITLQGDQKKQLICGEKNFKELKILGKTGKKNTKDILISQRLARATKKRT